MGAPPRPHAAKDSIPDPNLLTQVHYVKLID